MVQIALTEEQLKALDDSKGNAVLVNAAGHPVGYVSPIFSEAQIAEAERRARSDGPWYTTREVLDHLTSLERD